MDLDNLDIGTPVRFRRSDDEESVLSSSSEGVFIGVEDGEARIRRETEHNIRVFSVKPEWVEEEIEELSINSEDILSQADPIKCAICGGNCSSQNGIMSCDRCGRRIKHLSQGGRVM